MEKRFAILIGINDYDKNPLNFCVNDAIKMKEVLIKFARYEEDNIFLITSETNKKEDVTGKFYEIIKKIEEKFDSANDSIFFHFAGHGVMNAEKKSTLAFHNTQVSIEDIFNTINGFQPKHQFYVIDACESGGKVLTRSDNTSEEIIEKYIKNSSGVTLLYACQSTESAIEKSDKGHGILSYYFIEALGKKEIYDEGMLATSDIIKYVTKKTTEETSFTQKPVFESRESGFYPFAFLKNEPNKKVNDGVDITETSKTDILNSDRSIKLDLFGEKNRIEYQNFLIKLMQEVLTKKYEGQFKISSYKIEYENHDLIYGEIVKYNPLKSTFIVRKEENPEYVEPNETFNNLFLPKIPGFNNSVIKKKEKPKYFYYHDLNINSKFYKELFLENTVKDILEPKMKIGVMLCQAKWGLIMALIYTEDNWNGEEYTNSKIEFKSTTINIKEENQRLKDEEKNNLEKYMFDFFDDKINYSLSKIEKHKNEYLDFQNKSLF